MSNDNIQMLTPLTNAQAIETLDKMIGQLQIVMQHFSEQTNVSTQTKTRTLGDMTEQLTAMQLGRNAIAACEKRSITIEYD